MKTVSLSRFFVFILATTAPILTLADDTDIYLAAESSGDSRSQYESNILFVIDTSGSMDNGRIGEYNPDVDYIQELEDLGIPHTCERGKLYRKSGDITDDDIPHINCGEFFLYEAQFECTEAYDISQPFNLTEHGFWNGEVQQYNTDPDELKWENLISGDTENGFPYACLSESGRFNSDGDREYMVEDTPFGFSTDPSDEISLSSDDYTLFTANYLAWYNDYIRIEVLNRVFKNTVDDLNTGNVGVMRFDSAEGDGSTNGGMVIYAMDHISGIRSDLINLADTHFTTSAVGGSTPLAETLWEAYLYYSGGEVDQGEDSEPVSSVTESRLAGDNDFYQTPIQKACQKNFVVYLTDGEPESDSSRDDEIQDLTLAACDVDDGDDCLDELAAWMSENDIAPSIGIGTANEAQTVTTHTIGFGLDSQLLRDAASKSGGRYFSAANASDLKAAFDSILREVTADSGSFTPPAVSVNAFSRLMHRDDLYFTLFKPSVDSHWDGNLKKYRLKKISGVLQIVDMNGNPAVNHIDGTFKKESRSFWTQEAQDGEDIAKGGAASNLDFYLQNGNIRPHTALPGNSAIDAFVNAIYESNHTNITKNLLDIATKDSAYHIDLIRWIRGMDRKDHDGDTDLTEFRKRMGDPLHTQPLIVTYGGTEDAPDVTVFMTTNDGFLHAIDADNGQEQAVYIPAELLKKQKLAYDEGLSTGKLYGLDGGIAAWINDNNQDGIINEWDGDHVYLYIAMRRGGGSYYALDVTDRSSPRLLWQIDQGGDFAHLGQTWSKPFLADLDIGGTTKKVLIFGGGFDNGGPDGASEDDLLSPAAHDIGNAIYFVDAEDGSLLYSASNDSSGSDQFTDMDFAIPSDIGVVDVNSDGYHDRMYVGDLGGQVWRFDIKKGESGAGLVDGAVIAKLGRTAGGTVVDHRRFFNRPDISLIVDEINGTFLSIAIGSGRRNEPTDNHIQDRFFSIWDKNVYTKPATYPTAVISDELHDATDNLIAEGTTGTGGTQEQAATELAAGKGWFIDLEHGDAAGKGEKALATSITLDNQILFTTYVPAGSESPDSCEAGTGSGRFYAVKVATAEPVTHYEWADSGEGEDPTKNDRSKKLARSGIPSSPIVLFPEANNGETTVLAGTEIQDIPLRQRTRKTYWYNVEE